MDITKELDSLLFAGIEKEDLGAVLHCTGYHTAVYRKDQPITLEQERIHSVGIVLSGGVDMIKEDIWGNKTMLVRMRKGDLFGETFAWGDDPEAVVSFTACEDTQVLFIPFDRAMRTCAQSCEFHHKLVENMVRLIANKNRELMRKIEVVSKKTLREKLLAYLSIQSQQQESRYVNIPLDRAELAQYLCADRSAVSRELAAMKADGLIDYHKNTFRII